MSFDAKRTDNVPDQTAQVARAIFPKGNPVGSCRVPGCWSASSDKCGDKGAEQGFAASACVVHELEEAEV